MARSVIALTASAILGQLDAERWIATSWQNLLGRTEVGAGDDSSTSGGDSPHATQFVASLRDSVDVDLPVRRLFTDPVLERFATRVDEQLAGHLDTYRRFR